jgi:hypothetical protein
MSGTVLAERPRECWEGDKWSHCPDDHRRVADTSARLNLAQAWDTDVRPSVLVCSAEAPWRRHFGDGAEFQARQVAEAKRRFLAWSDQAERVAAWPALSSPQPRSL